MRIYTQGSFDLLHSGHLKLLRSCARFGDVFVSLLSDEAYEAYRGHPPVMPFNERRQILKALSCVDQVIEGDNRETKQELRRLWPDIVAVGSVWAKKDIYAQYGVTQQWLEEQDILLVYFPYTEGISSTDIKKRICKT